MTIWTTATKQAEIWTSEDPAPRVFDPHVFDRSPIFDTGSAAGVWDDKSIQTETWTNV